jgi:conjugal transfer pilus assembly protein TraF
LNAEAKAVMDPTFSNVKAYMEIQKELMDRSSRFAHKWLEIVFQRPELDYTLTHPTSQTGRHVYSAQKQREVAAGIRALSKTHGLFFFFSSACEYCKAFAPIVQSFSRKYGWKVLAISMDGSRLPEFPDAIRDNGAARNGF